MYKKKIINSFIRFLFSSRQAVLHLVTRINGAVPKFVNISTNLFFVEGEKEKERLAKKGSSSLCCLHCVEHCIKRLSLIFLLKKKTNEELNKVVHLNNALAFL